MLATQPTVYIQRGRCKEMQAHGIRVRAGKGQEENNLESVEIELLDLDEVAHEVFDFGKASRSLQFLKGSFNLLFEMPFKHA